MALQGAGAVLYKLPLLLVLAGGAALLVRALGAGGRFRLALVGLWLAYQGVLTGASASAWYGGRFSAREAHTRFVADFLARASAGRDRPLSVYWPTDLREVWYRARANSYFNSVQLSGCSFNRGTAVEGRRRADRVRAFEREELRRQPIPEPWWQSALLSFHGGPGPEPCADDLRRLCADEGVDFVILPRNFEGLFCASDGRLYMRAPAPTPRPDPEVRSARADGKRS
jgi:hypothetical protein